MTLSDRISELICDQLIMYMRIESAGSLKASISRVGSPKIITTQKTLTYIALQ
jgi:hypothetical protein